MTVRPSLFPLLRLFPVWLMLIAPAGVMAQLPVPDPAEFRLADGFQAELVCQVPEGMGSWVSLATTPDGLIASDQYGKLYRIHPPAGDHQASVEITPLEVELGFAQGLTWAFDALYVVAHARGNEAPAGLYRVTDSNGDDQLDKVELLRAFEGGGEHGPHAVIPGPDGKSLYVCAGNHTRLTEIDASRLPQNWDEDNLLPRIWDPGGHAVGIMAPGGWICKTDPDGKSFELISAGFRNQYDIAFDGNGELFTYDADMEWDIGTTWYRPTRVCHVTSGSEFGWRGGDAKWPTWFPDSLPAIVDIGPGSPTGIAFGTDSHFPARYQQALYIADWSFGFIYAVHLTPSGASFRAETEVFCSAPALQVTDMAFHDDGMLYFAIGGRRTPSALYRVRASDPVVESASIAAPTAEAELRHDFEQYHLGGIPSDDAMNQVFDALGHDDRFIRYAARVALEQTPIANWHERARQQTNVDQCVPLLIALARTSPKTESSARELLQWAVTRFPWSELSESQRIGLLRGTGLIVTRHGPLDEASAAIARGLVAGGFPDKSSIVNRELARLHAALGGDGAFVAKAVELMESAETQEDQIHYAICLRVCDQGWTRELQRRYLQWFQRSGILQGGRSFAGFLTKAREEFVAALDEGAKTELAELINTPPVEADPYAELTSRPVVQDWQTEDLLPLLKDVDWESRDLENGEKVFTMAQCYKCHQFEGRGGIVGPDLTALSRRYTPEYVLETIVDPDKAISEQYQATLFQLDDGRVIVGRVANLNGNNLMVQTDMIAPGKLTSIDRNTIEATRPSTTSPMPGDLLNTFTEDDVLDLLAFLRSADVVPPAGAPER